jgi:hypothetical protein
MTVRLGSALAFALAVLAAGLCCGAAHASAGAEPWCLNDDEGNSHCNYPSSQACLAAVSGGGRGFCNVNSSGPAASAAAARAPASEHRKHRSPNR